MTMMMMMESIKIQESNEREHLSNQCRTGRTDVIKLNAAVGSRLACLFTSQLSSLLSDEFPTHFKIHVETREPTATKSILFKLGHARSSPETTTQPLSKFTALTVGLELVGPV